MGRCNDNRATDNRSQFPRLRGRPKRSVCAMATAQPSWHASSCLEKVLEHRFLAELTSALWLGGVRDFEVLRSDVDSHGYDLVIEANGILRHIQLKAMVCGGK